jgi:biopolymer transport protein ExbD
MAGKFARKKEKKSPGISTASLPDIVFMLLFFFMVATVMRDEEPLVEAKIPQAEAITKLEKKEWLSIINIGPPIKPLQEKYGTAPRIQLNDEIKTKDDIIEFVENERLAKEQGVRPFMIFTLKVDKDTKMGIVTDVKQELRRANALKITYSAVRGTGRNM